MRCSHEGLSFDGLFLAGHAGRLRRSLGGGVLFACVLLCAAPARATTDPASHTYVVLGFSQDGRHAYFKKAWSGGAMDCRETWLSVYRTSTRRLAVAVPLRREGNGCQKRRISEQAGQRVATKIYARYGALVPGHRLRPAGKDTLRSKAKGFSLRLSVRGIQQALSLGTDFVEDRKKRARLTLKLLKLRGSDKTVLWSQRRSVKPVADPGGRELLVWPSIHLTDGRLTPDGAVFALVIGDAPLLIAAPPAGKP